MAEIAILAIGTLAPCVVEAGPRAELWVAEAPVADVRHGRRPLMQVQPCSLGLLTDLGAQQCLSDHLVGDLGHVLVCMDSCHSMLHTSRCCVLCGLHQVGGYVWDLYHHPLLSPLQGIRLRQRADRGVDLLLRLCAGLLHRRLHGLLSDLLDLAGDQPHLLDHLLLPELPVLEPLDHVVHVPPHCSLCLGKIGFEGILDHLRDHLQLLDNLVDVRLPLGRAVALDDVPHHRHIAHHIVHNADGALL
mmetsp:Transcript_66704/g.201345  ORF Transcript_66704/g.201345 Transcript_66704/m.201345 type:complete len:246 (-) Transcript_66704:626-1363(-)